MAATDKRKIGMPVRISVILLLAAVLTVCVSFAFPRVSALAKPGRVTLISAKSASYNSIKLTWKKAAKAKKYEVYCAQSKNGNYKRVGTTSKLTFTHKKLKLGKKYYYKVRATNGAAKGPFSNIKGAMPTLGKPKAWIEAYGVECLITCWDSVPGAQYYEVERCSSADDSNYELLGTIESESYDDYDLDTLFNYYYRIRAVRRVGSKTYHSAWSNEVCAFLEVPPEDVDLTNGLDVKPAKMSNGNIIAVVKNNNSETVEAYLKIRFLGDNEEHAAAIAAEAFIDLTPGRTVYARFRPVNVDDQQVSYKDYKLYVSATGLEYDYTDYSDKIDVNIDPSDITQKQIKVTVTNKTGLDISAEAGFVFFDKDNNVVDFNTDIFLLNGSESRSEVLSTIDLGTQEYDRIEPVIFRAGVL